jgi:hypothetical protein
MVLKTRSWSLFTVPNRSSPRVVIVTKPIVGFGQVGVPGAERGPRFEVGTTKVGK